MGRATLTSVEEYLNTSYSPDCEYLEGHIVERHVGEKDHRRLQAEITILLGSLRERLGIQVYVEQRVQVKAERYRTPDVCVTSGPPPQGQIFTTPPFLCIEILSRDDRASDLLDKIDDYLEFGVAFVWVVDPRTRRAWVHTASGGREVKNGVLVTRDPEISLPLTDLFAQLDD